ncbi:Metal-dependent hydrolase, beta-lactamase superfamily II [Caloramator quimbayensis]|uniref:Metal-dependent hydrolase, beta-lactamase superfamily II n=1 Tax=Caloramator quimbayensis TaxID=1147123 RepID=A0A1T4XKK4_9CLOT|nr:MBL fold metallo-hydrolase [Caloramator quimbayensis]SKA90092.1 Metal-dependent hydrolase, beta-lactamase superfamily II [Caloramator quimbayensis]
MKRFLLVLSIIFVVLFSSCLDSNDINNISDSPSSPKENQRGVLTISFIDVDQGDAILIKTPNGKFVLVDSGSQNEKEKFFKFISRQNIEIFDALIATHPHEDHIGNMDEIVSNYKVLNIYMPKVTSNTATFRSLMEAVKDKSLKIKNAYNGVNFDLDGVKFEFLAPNNSRYDDLNNYSAVLKITYANKSFMLMGDAEKLSEGEILKNNENLKADVIKIGHHGSSSSSAKSFISAVSPKYAVISCGKDNDYGHPHRETIKLLNDFKVNILRTDMDGTIIFSTDGENIKVLTNK